jgi:superfamily II RNA helicase
MVWAKATEINKLPLTEDVSVQLAALEKALEITLQREASPAAATKRPLPFKPLPVKSMKLLPSNTTAREFLLEHCGPYLERSFDSAPDPRVPSFHPDAWQRKVLDAIDANKSVLAAAPTSAGKTFISFYAMKKVLQANDDDILVYVAPTKALVNQIAAEVQARFSKNYARKGGKFVWAIHTRDYRVNNVKGCQILVTVPQMLQILLLAPVHARGPNDFSRRIKRIIFDEVHCIGQSDDGVIWEQLLLLAPCPIIALSATVGNPDDFKDWLERSQRVKGFELEMIVHSSRYSDLRKFIHDPVPSVSEFTGLAPVERLPFPGLDSEVGGNDATPFLFVHPIGSVVDKYVPFSDLCGDTTVTLC